LWQSLSTFFISSSPEIPTVHQKCYPILPDRQIDNGLFDFGSGFAWRSKLMEEFGLGSMSIADGPDLVAANMRDLGDLPPAVGGQ
jgi:hypothetical protein